MSELENFRSLGRIALSIVGVSSLLNLVACSSEFETPPSTQTRQELASSLTFEEKKDWTASANAKLTPDSLASEGKFAVSLRYSSTAFVRSSPRAITDPITRVGFDVRTEDEQVSGTGKLEVSIACPSLNVDEQTVGEVDLNSVNTGRFETVSFDLSRKLQEILSRGCRDLSVQIGVFGAYGHEVLAFDRLEFDYEIEVARVPLCGIAGRSETDEDELENGYLRRHSWRSGLSTQLELARIQDLLRDEPDIIGFSAEDDSQQFIIVVDTGSTESLESLAARWARHRPTIPYRVQHSCRERGELNAALEVIRSEAKVRGAKSLAYSLDPSSSHFDVMLDPKDFASGKRITEMLGDLVSVQYRAAGEHGRMDDGEPHYGAAAIENLTAGRACTAGFVVNKGTTKGAVTAGHCADATNEYFYSGPYFWGESTASGWPSNTTSWDMVFIGPSTPPQTYSAKIHTDPCCPSNRPVTTKVPPAVSQIVCITGRTYKAKCTVEVFKKEPSYTIDGKARKNVWFGRRTGVNIATEGDSGAPLYIPVGSGNAAIVGMHIAGFQTAPFDQTWFHSVSDVEAQLGVTVAY